MIRDSTRQRTISLSLSRNGHASPKNTSSIPLRLRGNRCRDEEGEEGMAQPVTKRQELAVAISEVGEKYAFEAQSRTRTHSHAQPFPSREAYIGISLPRFSLLKTVSRFLSLLFFFPSGETWLETHVMPSYTCCSRFLSASSLPSLSRIRFHDLSLHVGTRGNRMSAAVH